MSTAKHSPLPWRYENRLSKDGDNWPIIFPATPSLPMSVAETFSEANAALIVKSANAFPKLVERLQWTIEKLNECGKHMEFTLGMCRSLGDCKALLASLKEDGE